VSQTAACTVTIVNKLGLHARPAMLFVETASGFEAEIKVRRKDASEIVDGKSIMQMMMLAATQGTEIEITATGTDAETAVEKLISLVKSRFQED
jgi:phosphocarrier protein HPr